MMYMNFDEFENPVGVSDHGIQELNELEDKLFLLRELEMYYHEAALTINQYEKTGDIAELNINNQASMNTVRVKIDEIKDKIDHVWYIEGGAR